MAESVCCTQDFGNKIFDNFEGVKEDSLLSLALNPSALHSHVHRTAPVLSPLIYRLRDSRCSGQSKQRGSCGEGGLPTPVCYYLAPRCTKKKQQQQKKNKRAGTSLGMQNLFSSTISARAQGHTTANVLFSRCQQERKLNDTWLVFSAIWKMSLTSAAIPDTKSYYIHLVVLFPVSYILEGFFPVIQSYTS